MTILVLAIGLLSANAEVKGRNVLLTCAVPEPWTVPPKIALEMNFDNNLTDRYELTDEAKNPSWLVNSMRFGDFVLGDMILLIQESGGDLSIEFRDRTDGVVSRGYDFSSIGPTGSENPMFLAGKSAIFPDFFEFQIGPRKLRWLVHQEWTVERSTVENEDTIVRGALGKRYSAIFEAECY